ncbi:hypothetical protein CP8484711_0780B, partial [Chlamydia psittaci 84-8471/1]
GRWHIRMRWMITVSKNVFSKIVCCRCLAASPRKSIISNKHSLE